MRLFDLLERNQQITELAYHGTSSVFLDSILKHGLDPYPEQRVYDVEDEYSDPDASIATIGGVYLTKQKLAARDNAKTTTYKFGGEPIIVTVQYSVNSELADEDDIYSFVTYMVARKHDAKNFRDSHYDDDQIVENIHKLAIGDSTARAYAEQMYRKIFRVSDNFDFEPLWDIYEILDDAIDIGDIDMNMQYPNGNVMWWIYALYEAEHELWNRARSDVDLLISKTGKPKKNDDKAPASFTPNNTFRFDRKIGYKGKTRIIKIEHADSGKVYYQAT